MTRQYVCAGIGMAKNRLDLALRPSDAVRTVAMTRRHPRTGIGVAVS